MKLIYLFLLFLSISLAAPIQNYTGQTYVDDSGNDVLTNMTTQGLYASKSFVLVAPTYSINMTIDTTGFDTNPKLNFTFVTDSVALLGTIKTYYFNGTSEQLICNPMAFTLPTTDTEYTCALTSNYNSTGISRFRVEASSAVAITGTFNFSLMHLVGSKNLTACQVIDQPGYYSFNQNIYGSTVPISEIQGGATACLKIGSSNVVIDGNGFILDKNGAGGLTWGIVGNSTLYQNVTIKNVYMQSYAVGINLQNTNQTLLFNNSLISTEYSQILLNTVSNANVSTNILSTTTAQRAISVQSGNNNSVENNVVTGGAYAGIYLYQNTNSSILNNSLTTFNHYGIEIFTADNINIQSNTISATTVDAIYATDLTNSIILNNSLSSASYTMYLLSSPANILVTNNTFTTSNDNGPRFDNANNITFTTNTIIGTATGSIGSWFVNSANSLFTSNIVNGFGYYSLAIEGSSYINATNNSINNAGAGNGIGIISSSSYINATNNTISNAQYGIYLLTSDYVRVYNNSLDSNVYGMYVNANNNILDKNLMTNSAYGIYMSDATNNIIQNNTAHDMTDACFYVQTSTNIASYNNLAYNCLQGIYYYSSANGLLVNNVVFNNTYGIYSLSILGSSDNKIVRNNSAYNNQYGAHFQYTNNDLVFNNSFYNNTQIGLSAQDNRNLTIQANQIYNNTVGSRFYGATFSTYNGSYNFDHFYNNPIDLKLQSNGGNTLFYSLNGVIFDSPRGTLRNYTNLTINDTVGSGVTYTISWSGGNTTTPTNTSLFNNKTINITTISGSPTIDLIQWKWTAAEASTYNESNLTIYSYLGGWSKKDAILNVTAHTLTITSLSSPDGIYAILDDENPRTSGGSSSEQLLIYGLGASAGIAAILLYRRARSKGIKMFFFLI